MQSFHTVIVATTFASLLLCSSAMAKPDDKPPEDPPPAVDVNVVNTPLDVNIQPEDFEQIGIDHVSLGNLCFASDEIYVVPDGFRLKIVEVHARMSDNTDPNLIYADAGVQVLLRSTADGDLWNLVVASGNEIPVHGGKSTEIYADPGESVDVGWASCSNETSGRIRLIGFLVPVDE